MLTNRGLQEKKIDETEDLKINSFPCKQSVISSLQYPNLIVKADLLKKYLRTKR